MATERCRLEPHALHVMLPLWQVAQLQQKLKVAEAAAEAASKRAEQEAEFRVDVAQVRLHRAE